eukprot:CAMPEP_0181233988 /NCGR_PEP_ID=MMETSP1096-20121128/36678_1 /TAXON_ID=156174 ORGANISM="Chrysochromulina ericina, Strain CCMP281" /NCGR_SAMPLE_ID=MMETSP1096 /ASSEMBLY_ACC=CAM_ASM_000453 /LENGTH=43 /DNA_ID= /DNA_START= /DNA_END= /DNA_ORIENTATION=
MPRMSHPACAAAARSCSSWPLPPNKGLWLYELYVRNRYSTISA